MKVRIFQNSVKFYLPRLEGYLETVRAIADVYGSMSLVELDGYFEGKLNQLSTPVYRYIQMKTNQTG